MYIFITFEEWGRSRLRTFGVGALDAGADYPSDWPTHSYDFEADIYPFWWAS